MHGAGLATVRHRSWTSVRPFPLQSVSLTAMTGLRSAGGRLAPEGLWVDCGASTWQGTWNLGGDEQLRKYFGDGSLKFAGKAPAQFRNLGIAKDEDWGLGSIRRGFLQVHRSALLMASVVGDG